MRVDDDPQAVSVGQKVTSSRLQPRSVSERAYIACRLRYPGFIQILLFGALQRAQASVSANALIGLPHGDCTLASDRKKSLSASPDIMERHATRRYLLGDPCVAAVA